VIAQCIRSGEKESRCARRNCPWKRADDHRVAIAERRGKTAASLSSGGWPDQAGKSDKILVSASDTSARFASRPYSMIQASRSSTKSPVHLQCPTLLPNNFPDRARSWAEGRSANSTRRSRSGHGQMRVPPAVLDADQQNRFAPNWHAPALKTVCAGYVQSRAVRIGLSAWRWKSSGRNC